MRSGPVAGITWALDGRLRRLAYEFAKFGVVGIAGVFIANAVYDLLNVRHGVAPVTSATVATVVAAVATYLGNRYWSFRRRQRAGVAREVVIFAVLNGIGLLIQDAVVACNSYLLHLEHDRLAAFVALNLGIALATLFRFWSYRRFVWSAPPAPGDGPRLGADDAEQAAGCGRGGSGGRTARGGAWRVTRTGWRGAGRCLARGAAVRRGRRGAARGRGRAAARVA
jgi:putative flippase GtrA